MTTSETISLTRWIFVGKVMSLIFNMLSRLVISFIPRSKHLLISWLQSPTAVTLEPPKIKFLTLWWHYCRPPPRELIPYPGLLNPEPQPLWQATADLYLHRSHSNTHGQVWLNLCGFSSWAKHFVWALWASLAGMGFDSKHNFASPTILFRLLLCPWRWGILFFGGIQHSPVDGCSAVSCSFWVLAAEDECLFFNFAILFVWLFNLSIYKEKS